MCLSGIEIQAIAASVSPQILYATAIIIGALIGSLSSYPSQIIRIRFKRKKLRRVLYSEINGLDWLAKPYTNLDKLSEDIKTGSIPTHTYVPREVYDSELENIGLLSQAEIDAVHDYYRMTNIAEEQLEIMCESDTDEEHVRETFANKTLYQLDDRRDAATTALEAKM